MLLSNKLVVGSAHCGAGSAEGGRGLEELKRPIMQKQAGEANPSLARVVRVMGDSSEGVTRSAW